MKNIGAIICELNPFTFGHKYLIENSYKSGITHLIAIMSGNFVQRGEPSIISKQARTEIALSCGFDLVIEIPSIWSMSTAEKYAYSGVFLANSLGCIDNLIFGSECGNIYELDKISDVVVSSLFRDTIKPYLTRGYTFAKAREFSIKDILGLNYATLLKSPNNILAIEYLKSLKLLNSPIIPVTTKRIGSAHNSMDKLENISSSSYIRDCIIKNNSWVKYVPDKCNNIIRDQIDKYFAPADINHVDRAILYKLQTMKKCDLSLLPDISEGLENRIFKFINNSFSFKDLVSKVKTKRYTESRIRRIIMSAFLGINKSLQARSIPYINVLGSTTKGIEILREAQKTSSIPIISRRSDISKLTNDSEIILDKESIINSIYSLMSPEVILEKKRQLKFIFKKG